MFEELNARRQAVAENIEKSFQSVSEDDFEKARVGQYKDNAENRRLFRVGKSYGNANGGNRKGDVVEAVVNGKTIRGKFEGEGVNFYGKKSLRVHLGGNSYYNIDADNKTFKNLSQEDRDASKEKKRIEAEERRKDEARITKINNRKQALYNLGREEARIRREMESDPEVIANLEDGNHPAVVKYANQLNSVWKKRDKIYSELKELTKKD